ncbi:hypothetical protein [Dickeya oryzae]|uniref:hypothetical protein n=1 Tax=Dickeya oryzae TaxID=1240404 RepID=UPI0005775ADD|nr:hypothetical protein [Dickeya oryzae]
MSSENKRSIVNDTKVIIALVGIIIFLIFVILPAAFDIKEPYQKIMISLGTSIFVALTASLVVNKLTATKTNYEVRELINEKFPKLLMVEDNGLENVVYNNNMELLDINIIDPAELYIIMNDGRNFFTNNSRQLSERFKKENKKTFVVLMDPKSDAEKFLCKKNGKTEDCYYGKKIEESRKEYIEFHKDSPKTNVLDIYYCPHGVSLSIVATDIVAVIGVYRNSAGKALTPPHFIFKNIKKDCEYTSIMEDVSNLIKSSTLSKKPHNI